MWRPKTGLLLILMMLVVSATAAATGLDQSNRFLVTLARPGGGLSESALVHLRDRYQLLLVRGLMSDSTASDSYFEDQLRWLRQRRFGYHLMGDRDTGFSGSGSTVSNAAAIHKRIVTDYGSDPRPYIIISHSKGGLDTLAALLGYPDLYRQGKVVGWIALQTPFSGTPLADWLAAPLGLPVFDRLDDRTRLPLPVTDMAVLADLGSKPRRRYLAEHAVGIRDLLQQLPVLSFGSWLGEARQPGRWSSLMLIQDMISALAGVRSDGVIPLDSTVLRIDGRVLNPYIAVKGLDHYVPVSYSVPLLGADPPGFRKFDRVQFLRSLLAVWLTLPQNR